MDLFDTPDLTPETFQDGYHPLELFLKGDTESRSELLLNHPEIVGFIYRQNDDLMKAFFCTKVIDWHETNTDEFKVIAAINGTTEEYTPISVPETILFSDQIHLVNNEDVTLKDIKTCVIHKSI